MDSNETLTLRDSHDGTVEFTADASDERGAVLSVTADNGDAAGIYLNPGAALQLAAWLIDYAATYSD